MNFKVYAAGLIAVAFFSSWVAHSFTSSHYQTILLEQEVALKAQITKDKELYNERLIQTTNQLRDELNRTIDLARARGADIERLRNANKRLQGRIEASPASADREALARCSQLLSEGAGLVTEGEGLLLKHGAEHDSLIRIEKWQ